MLSSCVHIFQLFCCCPCDYLKVFGTSEYSLQNTVCFWFFRDSSPFQIQLLVYFIIIRYNRIKIIDHSLFCYTGKISLELSTYLSLCCSSFPFVLSVFPFENLFINAVCTVHSLRVTFCFVLVCTWVFLLFSFYFIL